MTRQPTNATAPGAAQTSRVAHSEGDAAGVPARTRQDARIDDGPRWWVDDGTGRLTLTDEPPAEPAADMRPTFNCRCSIPDFVEPTAPPPLTDSERELARLLNLRLNRAMSAELEREVLTGQPFSAGRVLGKLMTETEKAISARGGSVEELLAEVRTCS